MHLLRRFCKVTCFLKEMRKGVTKGDVEQVKKVLKAAEEFEDVHWGENFLTSDDWVKTLQEAVEYNHQDIGLVLIDHAEKVYHADEIRQKIEDKAMKILETATGRNMVSFVKRMIGVVDVSSFNADQTALLLRRAAALSNLEIVEAFLNAGFSASRLFTPSEDFEYDSPEQHDLRFINSTMSNPLDDEDRRVWEQILSHMHAEEVITPCLINESVQGPHYTGCLGGGEFLNTMEELGMDFTPCISSGSKNVKECMCMAIDTYALPAVQFLIDHGFDVNVSIQGSSTTALHYILDFFVPHGKHKSIVLALIQGGSCPHLKDDKGQTAEDLCIKLMQDDDKDYDYKEKIEACALFLKLFCQIGYILAKKNQRFIHNYCQSSSNLQLKDLASELRQVPTLQCISRAVIHSEKGSRLKVKSWLEKLGQDELPKHLRDFALLKDFDWNTIKNEVLSDSDEDSDEEGDVAMNLD